MQEQLTIRIDNRIHEVASAIRMPDILLIRNIEAWQHPDFFYNAPCSPSSDL
jgi:hypothetical protein